MKKLVYILIAFSAFSFGIVVYSLRPIISPVSLCEISQHTELYKFNDIRIKAYLDNVGIDNDSLSYSVFDFGNNCLTGADLDISESLKEQLKNDKSLKVFINELRQKNNELMENRAEGHFIGQVEIIGSIEKVSSKTDEIAGLISPLPFVIRADEIKQISPVHFMSHEEILEILIAHKQE